jgi:crossover junction endodeoxyribonuclease RuvC
MKILGIDPSTKTGWTLLTWDNNRWSHKSGVQLFRGTGFERVHTANLWLKAFLAANAPDLVVIEGYAYGNAFTIVTLVEVGTALRLALYEGAHSWYTCPPTVLKKFVCGKGTVKKEQILLEVYKHWGIAFSSSDEADSFGLAMMGLALSKEPGVPVTAVQRRVAETLKTE